MKSIIKKRIQFKKKEFNYFYNYKNNNDITINITKNEKNCWAHQVI